MLIRRCFKGTKFNVRQMSTINLIPYEKYDIKQGSEVTLYIKGFLSRGEKAENFKKWISSHEKMTENYNWGKVAKGWYWDCGCIQYPIPFATASHFLYSIYKNTKILRMNPWILAGSATIDAGIFSTRMIYQYKHAEKNTEKLAHKLKNDLIITSQKYDKVRIVAHSLGCKLLMNALLIVPEKYKPNTVHLCAPAFTESSYEKLLANVAKDKTYVYYTEHDIILKNILQIIRQEEIVGAVGLKKQYPKMIIKNVSEYFKNFWIVHNNYKSEFPNFIDPEKEFTKKYSIYHFQHENLYR